MRVLSVIVCHNFYYYLRNTLESLLEYFPLGDVLVIDNASTDFQLLSYLEKISIKNPRVEVVFRDTNISERKVGSLYDAYNVAIEHAIEHDYDYLQLISDDVQYMWTDDKVLEKVDNLFKTRADAMNVSAMFLKKINDYNLHRRIEIDDATSCYRSLDYGVNDDGFFSVKTLSNTGFRFLESENAHSKYMLERGYHLYFLRDPFINFIPWPATRRGGKVIGRQVPPKQQYYLKPLEPAQIIALKERPISEYPYQEDYCFTWGYASLTPYWVTNPSIGYIGCLTTRRWKAKKFILIPHFELRGMTPTTGSMPLIQNAARILRSHEPSLFLWLKLLLREQAVRPWRMVRRALRLRRPWAPSQ